MRVSVSVCVCSVYVVYVRTGDDDDDDDDDDNRIFANKPITTRYTLYEFGLLSDDDTSATPSTLSNAHMHTHTFTLYTREEHTRPPY